MDTEESTSNTPMWCPEQQIYIGGIVPENAEVKSLIEKNNGCLRLFGYGSLCWNPGTGALAKAGVVGTLGRARGYKRCWAQRSTDHRGNPKFPGIVCTLLEDQEVYEIRKAACDNVVAPDEPTMTEGVIYLIPPELVDECLDELDFREKGGYARDVIEVVEDEIGETHQALLYRGTPDNPAIWPRAMLDLPFAAGKFHLLNRCPRKVTNLADFFLFCYFVALAIMSVSEGPSGKNDFYLNSLDRFLTDTHTIAAENDDTTSLASMTRGFQENNQLYFLFGCGSNQHNQLLLERPNNGACLAGEDAHEKKEIVLCTLRQIDTDYPKELYAGGGHSGLLTESGKMFLWGWNDSGQCGTSGLKDENTSLSFPVVPHLSNIIVEKAALGFSHTLVIERGTNQLFAFGNNERGQVNGKPSSSVAVPVTPDFLKDEEINVAAAGLFHSGVVTKKGELITFGCGRFGQSLGIPTKEDQVWIGRWKPDDGSQVMDVACGRRHTVAVDDKGRVWSFGDNKYGQLGRPIVGKMDQTPTLVDGLEPVPRGSIVSVDCGWSHTLLEVNAPDGNVYFYGMGRNDKGQLGTGTGEPLLSPERLFHGKNLRSAACGSESTIAVDGKGTIWGCGWNEHGNLATQCQEDKLDLAMSVGAKVVGPPGLHGGRITIAVGGAHFFATKVP